MMFSPKFIHIVPNPGAHHGFPPPLSVSFDKVCNISKETSGEGAIKIGKITDKDRFSFHDRWSGSVACHFKEEGKKNYKIEKAYGQFEEALQIIADYESTFSDLHLYKENYITIRQSSLLAGKRQVFLPDWHTDGPHPYPHSLNSHIYIVSDREGTLVQAAPISDAFNRLTALGELPKPNPDLFIRTEPYSIYLMTNLCFHKSPIMQKPGLRTFLRVTYDSPADEILKALPPEKRLKLGFD